MEWLNYHHLFYFWNVAKEGTVSAAAEKLHLARTTITAQVVNLKKRLAQNYLASPVAILNSLKTMVRVAEKHW